MTQDDSSSDKETRETRSQIGPYTALWNKQGIEIAKGNTTFAFTLTEAWDLISFLHERQDVIYRQLRDVGLRAYTAASDMTEESCCDYIREGLLRRGELVEGSPNEQGLTFSTVMDIIREVNFENERKIDQEKGWPSSPNEPITPHWTRINDTLFLCASKIAATYGTLQAQSSSTWRVKVDYDVLAEYRVDIQMGFWRMDHRSAGDELQANARQSMTQRLGLRQGNATYRPDEFLKRIFESQDVESPTIFEYDATNAHVQQVEQLQVVAKLYMGGTLKPFALVYRFDF